jgi:hypothetical protein
VLLSVDLSFDADRPAISIPPRKRRRILSASSEEDDSSGGAINDGQVVLRANFVNADEDRNDDSQEDEDYVLADEDESILEDEVRDLQMDLDPMQTDDKNRYIKAPKSRVRPSTLREQQRTVTRSQQNVQGLGLDAEGMFKLVDEKGRPFPGHIATPSWTTMQQMRLPRKQSGYLHQRGERAQ